MKRTILILLLISLNCSNSFGQSVYESFWPVWANSSLPDSVRLKAIDEIAWVGYLSSQPDSAFYFAQLQFDFAEKKDLKDHMATARNTQGASFYLRGNYTLAIDYHTRSLKLKEELGDEKGKAGSLNNIGVIYKEQGEYAKAIECFTECLKIFKKIADKQSIATTLNNMGLIYKEQGYFSMAISYYNASLEIRKEIEDKQGIAFSLGSIGVIYKEQGDYAKAISFLTECLKIVEETGDKKGISSAMNNIGLIYKSQGNYEKAISYYMQCLKIDEELGDKQGISVSLHNIGGIYYLQKDYIKSLDFHFQSLKIKEEIGSKQGTATSLNNIGGVFFEQGNYSAAVSYYTKSLSLNEEIGNLLGVASTLNNIGNIYARQGELEKAINYSQKALKIAQEIGVVHETKEAAYSLFKSYKAKKEYPRALAMFELYIGSRDSLLSEESQRAVIRQEFKYNYEKQAAVDSIKAGEEKKVIDAQIIAQQAQIQQAEVLQYALFGGLFLVLVFAGFMYNRFKETRKQKEVIEIQKEIVEEKQQEILDSINYAKRIQKAILPPIRNVKEFLPQSFILYKPKDIVAGDFYWMEVVMTKSSHLEEGYKSKGEEKPFSLQEVGGGQVLLAAADCTGHGVPGAMVSVICNNGLNRSVREHGITDPGKILDKTREIVIQEFEKSDEDVQDGMDIALCMIDFAGVENHNNLTKIKYAGANNPLWIIRKKLNQESNSPSLDSHSGFELTEYRPNKQPIGKYGNAKPFTTHNIELQKGDTIYIFTDGFADQFGGPKGKKFMYKPFKELLLSIQDNTMEKQEELLDAAFNSWKGTAEQVDDVCIIGVRI